MLHSLYFLRALKYKDTFPLRDLTTQTQPYPVRAESMGGQRSPAHHGLTRHSCRATEARCLRPRFPRVRVTQAGADRTGRRESGQSWCGPRVLLGVPPAAQPRDTTPTLLTVHSLLNFIVCCSLFAHCSEINAGAHVMVCFETACRRGDLPRALRATPDGVQALCMEGRSLSC